MTMPYERTKAVIETHELTQLLARPDGSAVPSRIQDLAHQLLRHFPPDVDIDVSAAALPGVWTPVQRDSDQRNASSDFHRRRARSQQAARFFPLNAAGATTGNFLPVVASTHTVRPLRGRDATQSDSGTYA